MHLPDGIISFEQAMIYWIITLIIILLFFYKFSKDENKEKRIISIALFSVFTIVITSLSIPSPFGVPIHFFLIPLIAMILGPFSSTIVSFIALLMQVFTLNMGGITSLGANFIVIGFILPIVTYSFYKLFLNLNKKLAIFGSTIIGIIAATFGQVGILLISGAMNFDLLLSTLVPFYLFISIIEGFCNVVIITSIEKIKPELIEINEI
ncbi:MULTISPECIES: energy-coupling factor ABC transporter permease [Methanobrevibacter]|uniref:energy-coupling factor ABC transporter permease n=1 Tax=Methanobrevibacter TaxID=2172 RepID=UPI0015B9723C|nr:MULTISPECIES: energy-coupling factor ABC transporter permease [Methanobrevibacter]MCI7428819.1 energy-coupling factor ABC transporter permease [Methanobrevibacter sp.]MDD6776483.1 energy-coupling factor ABC transporter permease [Methanobacteriaceae archaeon]MDY3096762.1 energy-coupling factor ABC transporter permease [Methanobrevibacter sp.]